MISQWLSGLMLLHVRCRTRWLAMLMRFMRNEVLPLYFRRHLIVVNVPRR